jgi:hypothetical protein
MFSLMTYVNKNVFVNVVQNIFLFKNILKYIFFIFYVTTLK